MDYFKTKYHNYNLNELPYVLKTFERGFLNIMRHFKRV